MSSGEKRLDNEPDHSPPFNAEALLKALKPLLQHVLPNSVSVGLRAAWKPSPVTTAADKYLQRCEFQQIYKFNNSSVHF
jgi:hypothetical protein